LTPLAFLLVMGVPALVGAATLTALLPSRRLEALLLALSSRWPTPLAVCRAAWKLGGVVPCWPPAPSAERLKVTVLPEALTGLLAGEREAWRELLAGDCEVRPELLGVEGEAGFPGERARLLWLDSDMMM